MSNDRLLPRRAGETDQERRLREALNRIGAQAMQAVDSAINLRSSPADVARTRNRARGHLADFAAQAMTAFHLSHEPHLPDGD